MRARAFVRALLCVICPVWGETRLPEILLQNVLRNCVFVRVLAQEDATAILGIQNISPYATYASGRLVSVMLRGVYYFVFDLQHERDRWLVEHAFIPHTVPAQACSCGHECGSANQGMLHTEDIFAETEKQKTHRGGRTACRNPCLCTNPVTGSIGSQGCTMHSLCPKLGNRP